MRSNFSSFRSSFTVFQNFKPDLGLRQQTLIRVSPQKKILRFISGLRRITPNDSVFPIPDCIGRPGETRTAG